MGWVDFHSSELQLHVLQDSTRVDESLTEGAEWLGTGQDGCNIQIKVNPT